jgi:hypothetical protein
MCWVKVTSLGEGFTLGQARDLHYLSKSDGCISHPQDDRITTKLWLCCSVMAALVNQLEKKDKSYVCPSNSSA